MLKLTRTLYAVNPKASLIDYYEKALYNHILASQHHETGMVTYFVPLRMGGRKEYSSEFNDFTCCVGTGMENHVKYGENIYHRGSDSSLYINLFIPSVLNWRERGMQLSQQSNMSSGRTSFIINTGKPATAKIRIRRPAWAKMVSLSVNGKIIEITADSSGYLVLQRTWRNNDKIELYIPPHFYTERMPDNKNRQAVFYGPLLMAGLLGDKEPEPEGIPVIVSNEPNINKWFTPQDSASIMFQTAGVAVPAQVTMIPFNATRDQHYAVYWDVFTPGEWTLQKKKYEAGKRKQKALEDRTVDYLRLGEMQPERDHNFVIEDGATGETRSRKWRSAGADGSMTFTMKVDSLALNTIVCTYWGMDNRGRIFDILVDDQKVTTEDLLKFRMSKFYEVGYPIPAKLTKSKSHVKLRFVPQKKNNAGPIYGVRMARGEVGDLLTPLTNESIYR
jgi:hypothetical protein